MVQVLVPGTLLQYSEYSLLGVLEYKYWTVLWVHIKRRIRDTVAIRFHQNDVIILYSTYVTVVLAYCFTLRSTWRISMWLLVRMMTSFWWNLIGSVCDKYKNISHAEVWSMKNLSSCPWLSFFCFVPCLCDATPSRGSRGVADPRISNSEFYTSH